jgi:hypothetical protein
MKFGSTSCHRGRGAAVNAHEMTTPVVTLGAKVNPWRAVCAERCTHGSAGGVGQHSSAVRPDPTLPVLSHSENDCLFAGFRGPTPGMSRARKRERSGRWRTSPARQCEAGESYRVRLSRCAEQTPGHCSARKSKIRALKRSEASILDICPTRGITTFRALGMRWCRVSATA